MIKCSQDIGEFFDKGTCLLLVDSALSSLVILNASFTDHDSLGYRLKDSPTII